MEETESIGFQLFQSRLPYSFAPVFGRNVHTDGGTSVARIKVEKIDATDSRWSLVVRRWTVFDDKPQLTIFVNVTGSGSDIIAQVLLGQGVMICTVCPRRRVVLPLIEKREIGRFYFTK